MHYAARINVPPRFQEELLTKTASTSFLVPDTNKGQQFLTWWGDAPENKRDSVMKLAFDNSLSITEAFDTYQKRQS